MQTKIILASAAMLILLISQALLGCAPELSSSLGSTSGDTTGEPVGQSAQSEASYIGARSLDELVAQATVIVVGRSMGTGETINMARNPNDISQPDPNILGLGQVYNIAVERYLKGGDASSLKVVQPEAFLTERMPKTPENIAKARSNYKSIPIRPTAKYLFFLRPLGGFPLGTYLTGTAHPWRFILPVGGNAEPESPWYLAKQVFPPMPTAALITQTEQLIPKK